MPILGNITNLLDPEYIKQGYVLSEDEDFVYLDKDNHIVAVFYARTFHMEKLQEYLKKS